MIYIEGLSSPVVYLILIIIALIMGSLLNVIIYRLPIILYREWEEACFHHVKLAPPPHQKINLFLPRSFCPSCKKTIPAWCNIPLLSYCLLLGRCKYCKQVISPRYFIVECSSLILSLLTAWLFGLDGVLIARLMFVWFIISLFFIDLEQGLLPDQLSLSLLWLGLIFNTHVLFTSLPHAVLSSAAGFFSLWSFGKIFYCLTGKIGMGQGDVKLFAAFGAWFGWEQLIFILFIASLSGAIIGSIYLLITKKGKNTPIPFGPFLCAAALLSLYWKPDPFFLLQNIKNFITI